MARLRRRTREEQRTRATRTRVARRVSGAATTLGEQRQIQVAFPTPRRAQPTRRPRSLLSRRKRQLPAPEELPYITKIAKKRRKTPFQLIGGAVGRGARKVGRGVRRAGRAIRKRRYSR